MEQERKIAIITDCHGMLEPLQVTIADIKKRKINEIYSLGDNIGTGPNPGEVIDLLMANDIKSVSGNDEYYISLGVAPFMAYFNYNKLNNVLWTLSKLNSKQLDYISQMPSSIELIIGGKKVALCHFASDVRTDWLNHGQSSYQALLSQGKDGYKLFENTNSFEQLAYLKKLLELYGDGNYALGIVSQLNDPLFKGMKDSDFDYVIQGHVHFETHLEKSKTTTYYTVRANGMGYNDDPIDSASYIIITEKENDLIIEKILLKYDRDKLIENIKNSDMPDKSTIKKYVRVKDN